ncbi:hypothetical protein LLE49_20890 [Alicyclobacillus tolerans]|uniref:hypothetical protein n=1 Tax=Alicyclobacillus tolerans TaxID=90970 RepID=UPI001F30D0B0|nr:hypothetical protein [Alicyclobacillus tolerans]MCF8567180.1 hypothetical protein [Alicyclobacillus tolerans]
MKWKGPLVYTAIGAILGSSLMASTPAFADTGFKSFWAGLIQNGQDQGKAQAIQFQGTNFFGIWYLNKLLAQDGIQASWNGNTLQLSNVPVQQPTTLSLQGSSAPSTSPIFSDAITVNGVTYVPLSSVQQLLQKLGVGIQSGANQGGPSAAGIIDSEQLLGVINKLQSSAQKLNQYTQAVSAISLFNFGAAMGPGPGRGESESEHSAVNALTSGLQQLQSAYDQLNRMMNALQAFGATATSGSTTSSTTGTSGTTTGTSTTQSVYQPATSSTLTSSQILTTLQAVATSLSSDWQAVNGYALNASAGQASNTSAISTAAADIEKQVSTLQGLVAQFPNSSGVQILPGMQHQDH